MSIFRVFSEVRQTIINLSFLQLYKIHRNLIMHIKYLAIATVKKMVPKFPE